MSLRSFARPTRPSQRPHSERRTYSDSIIKQPTLRRPVGGGGGSPSSVPFPSKRGGAERRLAVVRTAAPRGPPRGKVDLRIAEDRRPVTQAGAPIGALRRRSPFR